MKVIVGLAVVAVLAALGTNWARHRGESLLHHSFDTALPGEVEAHPWAPLRHGKPLTSDRVRFEGGTVTTARCHSALGAYSVRINHGFSFRSSTRVAACRGSRLQAALTKARHVEIEPHGKAERLVFTDDEDHTVARLQGRA